MAGGSSKSLGAVVRRYGPLFALPALAVGVFALIAWARIVHGISILALTRDMATVAQLPPYASIASSLGAFVMCAAATSCLFAFFAIRGAGRNPPRHILAVGLFSLYFMLDDFYELHDRVFPDDLGIPQQLIYALIAATVAAILIRWRHVFLGFRPWLLAAALLSLGASLAFDIFDVQLVALLDEWQYFWEDGAKLMGISLWATYHIALAQRELRTS